MPAIWASSERPLFVRTVWVDGMRHAILSPDDPVVNPRLHLRCRPRTSTETSYAAKHQPVESRVDRLNSCLVNLHMVVKKSLSNSEISSRIVRRRSAPPRARTCTERNDGLLEIYVDESSDESSDVARQDHRGTLENEKTTRPTFDRDSGSVERSSRSQRDPFSATEANKRTDGRSPDASWNPLSERVLQWLDLFGRARDYEPKERDLEESSGTEEERRRWRSAANRRRQLSQTRESSALATRERIIVQNYKLRKSYKLECTTKATSETRAARKSSSRKDTLEARIRRGDEDTKHRILAREEEEEGEEEEEDLKDKSRDDLMVVWSPPGRLQLHIIMPSFNSVEKRSSSLESLACD